MKNKQAQSISIHPFKCCVKDSERMAEGEKADKEEMKSPSKANENKNLTS